MLNSMPLENLVISLQAPFKNQEYDHLRIELLNLNTQWLENEIGNECLIQKLRKNNL